MLDFTARKEKFFDLKLPNGLRLQVPVMSMGLARKMEQIGTETGSNELLEMTTILLNTNKQFKKFKEEDVEKMLNAQQLMILFTCYKKWLDEVLSDPN